MTINSDNAAPPLETAVFLVWQPVSTTNSYPYPTIEYGRVRSGNGTTADRQAHLLTGAELGLSIDELKERYPYNGKTS